MYNEELEQLIDAALADGVLTEKEKQILFKKAESFGVDRDEFEMVLDARALKAQQAQQPIRPAKEKLGNIVTCPACGAHVPGGNAVCPECGHIFNNVEANQSAKMLEEKLAAIQQKYSKPENNSLNFMARGFQISACDDEMAKAILSFPVPNSRGDLLEFLPYLKSRAEMPNDGYNAKQSKASRTKYQECVFKAKMSFANDPAFQPYYQKDSIWQKILTHLRNMGLGV